MGECVICGKETNNRYDFYTAVKGKETVEKHRDYNFHHTHVTTEWHDIQKHSQYLCTSCSVSKFDRRVVGCMYVVAAVVMLPLIAFLVFFAVSDFSIVSAIVAAAGFAVVFLFVPWAYIRFRKKEKTDEPLSEDKGSAALCSLYGHQYAASLDRAALTVADYERLKQ